jgi:diaminopimelate decarboxylase
MTAQSIGEVLHTQDIKGLLLSHNVNSSFHFRKAYIAVPSSIKMKSHPLDQIYVAPARYIGKKDLAEPLGINRSGHLTMDGRDLYDFANEKGTRCYVFSPEQLERNAQRLLRAFEGYPGKFQPFYALKANSSLSIVEKLSERGFGIEVTNIHELMFVLERISDVKCICNGVSKHYPQPPYRESLIEKAFKYQASGYDIIVNLDSLTELEYALSVSEKMGKSIAVGIRLNLAMDESSATVNLATGAEFSRFGIPGEVAWDAIRKIHESKYLKLVELHTHLGSQIIKRPLQQFRNALLLARNYAIRAEEELGFHVEALNLGGGIAVNYLKQEPENMKNYNLFWAPYTIEEYAATLMNTVKEAYSDSGILLPELKIEPGRWLTANTTLLLLRVCNVFEIPEKYHEQLKGGKKWIFTDGSAITDALDIVWLKHWFEIVNVSRANSDLEEVYNIGGIACDSGDAFSWGKDITGPRKLPKTIAGDVLTVLDVGAYQQMLSSNYNLLPRPLAYLSNGEEMQK